MSDANPLNGAETSANSALALSAINQLRLILIPCPVLWSLAKKYSPPNVSFFPDAAHETTEQCAWQLLMRDQDSTKSIVSALKGLSELAESGACEDLRALSAYAFAHKLGQVLQLTPQAEPSSGKAARLWRCQWTRVAKAIRDWGEEPGWGWMQGELDEHEMRMQGKLPTLATCSPEEISVSADDIQINRPRPPDNLIIAAQSDVAAQLADFPDFDVPSSGLISDVHDLNGHTTAATEWAVFRLIEAGCFQAFAVPVRPKAADHLPLMLTYPGNLCLRPTAALWELWRNGKPAGGWPDCEEANATHNGDFTMVRWFGTEYKFSLGIQSAAIKVLWEEWKRHGMGLHQQTIRDSIDTDRDHFRMDTAFRGHPALWSMIQPCGDGLYKLAAPADQKPRPKRLPKKTQRKPPKARQKDR